MAANVVDYVVPLLQRQISAAQLIGVNLYRVDKQTWAVNLLNLIVAGTIMKAIADIGAVTDAQWQTRIDNALAGTWPDWVLKQYDPNAPVNP